MKDTDYMGLFDRRMEHDPLSAEEVMATLREFGLIVPDSAKKYFCPGLWYNNFFEGFASGHYDFDSRVWTPSSNQIFSFDSEVIDMDHMYLNYLKGLQSISEGELTFTDVIQDMSKVNWEEPSGKVGVTFRLNGMECRYDADFMGDWLDCHIREAVNRYLEELGIEKRFFATDASQGETIFFCTEEWARRFEEATFCYMQELCL